MSNKNEETRFNPFAARGHKFNDIRHIIAIASGKGGVGKSMVTSLMAISLQQQGFSVGILDGDITGPSIGKMFHVIDKAQGSDDLIEPFYTESGIKIISANMLLENDTTPITWRGPLIANAVKEFYTKVAWGTLDVLLIDMPPGTGDVPLTVYQSIPIDGVIMVSTPQDLVAMIVSKALVMAKEMNKEILGLIENMCYLDCPHCNQRIYPFGASRSENLLKQYNIPLLAQLPINPDFMQAGDQGKMESLSLPEFQQMVKKLMFKLQS